MYFRVLTVERFDNVVLRKQLEVIFCLSCMRIEFYFFISVSVIDSRTSSGLSRGKGPISERSPIKECMEGARRRVVGRALRRL